MKKHLLLVVFGLLSVFIFPSTVLATAIGVSPASISVKVFHGTQRLETINLSRDNTEGDTKFTVTAKDLPFVHLSDNTTVIIPDGEQSVKFTINIDGSNIDNGTYNGMLTFLLDQPGGTEQETVSGLTVGHALGVKIQVIILERPDPSVSLGLADFPTLISDLRSTDLSTKVSFSNNESKVGFSWNINNSGDNPLEGAQSHIQITHGDATLFDKRIYPTDAVPANSSLLQSDNFAVPNIYPSGQYKIRVWVGEQETVKTFWIIKPVLKKQILFATLGIVSILGSIYFFHRTKRRIKR